MNTICACGDYNVWSPTVLRLERSSWLLGSFGEAGAVSSLHPLPAAPSLRST